MSYSLSKILDKKDGELFELALICQLDPRSPNLKREILEKLESEKKLIHDYHFEFPKTKISLDEIICGRLLNDKNFQKLESDQCSELSGKIANNLIKVGAMRIFADAEKSFVEPVVNAIDAYQIKEGKRPVGKFGVGFYSLLYWVIKYPGSYLHLYSNPIPGPDEEAFQPWEGVITNTSFKIRPAKREEGVRFRLKLFIVVEAGIIEEGGYYTVTDTLQNISTAKLELSYDNTDEDEDEDEESGVINSSIGEGEIVKVNVITMEDDYAFIVEDNALGLPIYALGDLLVPSLSSKTIQSSSIQYIPKIGKLTRIKAFDAKKLDDGTVDFRENTSQLMNYILVGEIKIRGLPGLWGINIQLSPQTPLPVARDDILISNRLVREEFEMNVFYLLDLALERDPRNSPRELLQMLGSYPNGRYLVPILKQKIIEKGYYFVPNKYFSLYQQITERKLVGIRDSLSIETEALFIRENKPNFNLLVGRGVYFVNVPELTFADSTRLVFLPRDQVNDQNIASWVLLHQEQSLIPIGTKWESSEKVLEIIQVFAFRADVNDDIEKLLQVFFGKVYGLKMIFTVDSVLKCMELLSIVLLFNRYQTKLLPQMIAGFSKVCSLYKPAVAYGSVQKNLLTNHYGSHHSIPEGWEDLYLELFEKLIPLMVEEDVFYIFNFGALSFYNDYINTKNKVQNIEEWLYLNLFYRSTKVKFGSNDDLMLDYWRTYLRSEGRIKMLLKKLLYPKYLPDRSYYSLTDDTSQNTIIKPSQNYYNLIEKLSGQISSIPVAPKLQINNQKKYYLSRLLQNAFEKRSLDVISTERGNLPIQILEIAINEGTNKPPLEAMITETFQNSLDARKSNDNNEPIKIDLGRTGSLLSYSITDSVGITPEGITALSIPFLSSKTDPFLAGSIGSGFFTVYNRASVVNIITRRDGTETVITDTPLRENGRVVDVERRIGQMRTEKGPSTTITVYFESDEPKKELAEMLTYCQNVLPLTTDQFYLNGERIHIETETLKDFHSDLMDVRVGENFESYILTKGAPFRTLEGSDLNPYEIYLKDLINIGLIINLKKGFEPTQSRTKIRIDDYITYGETVHDIIYYYMLDKQLKNPTENYVRNFTSRANIYQILPPVLGGLPDYTRNLGSFLWYYAPLGTKTNLSMIVDDLIKNQPSDNANTIQREVAERWLEKKDMKKQTEAIDLDIVKGGKRGKNIKIDSSALDFAQRFTDAYVESLGIQLEAPKVNIAIIEGRMGEYDAQENIIRISSELEISSAPEKLTLDNILGYLENNFDIYGKRYPSSLMIHELEHFRRGQSHGTGAHQDIQINLKNYTFDESANYHYDLALKNGLLELLL